MGMFMSSSINAQEKGSTCAPAAQSDPRRIPSDSILQNPPRFKKTPRRQKTSKPLPMLPQCATILSSIRLTPAEKNFFEFLLANPQPYHCGLTEAIDKDMEMQHKEEFVGEDKLDSSLEAGTDTADAKEDESPVALGILEEIPNLDKAWRVWNSSQ
jgi:hypothetical protein